MTFPTVSHAAMDHAARLIKATDAEGRRIANLGRLIPIAEQQRNAAETTRNDLTDFIRAPDRLAHVFELLRHPDPSVRNLVIPRYQSFLDILQLPATTTYRPPTVDYAALLLAGRPFLLTPYLGLRVADAFPALCLRRSNPAKGLLVYTATGGPADPEVWQAALPAINQWLGGTWVVAHHNAGTIVLQRRPALPATIHFDRRFLQRGHVFLGIDHAAHRVVNVSLDQLTHMLIAGTPGSGKSVFLHAFLRSCLHSIDQFHRIYAICGQGIAFERYRGLHPKLIVNNEPQDFHALAADLQNVMKDRTARLVREGRDKMSEYILVLVDEWGAFNQPEGAGKAAKEAHAAFLHHVMAIGKRGRKAGLRLALVLQEPNDRDLSTGVRSTLGSIVSFRLPIAAHGQSLFGEITPPAVPHDVRTLPIGHAVFHNGATGQRVHLQVPLTPPPGGRR